MAPEVMISGDYGTPADVYSFGMFVYEVVTGCSPFVHLKTRDEIREAVVKKKERPLLLPPKLAIHDIIEMCWKQNPGDRPKIDDVMLRLLTETIALPGTEMDKVFGYVEEIGYQPTIKQVYRYGDERVGFIEHRIEPGRFVG
jgi:hypothetical protein